MYYEDSIAEVEEEMEGAINRSTKWQILTFQYFCSFIAPEIFLDIVFFFVYCFKCRGRGGYSNG